MKDAPEVERVAMPRVLAYDAWRRATELTLALRGVVVRGEPHDAAANQLKTFVEALRLLRPRLPLHLGEATKGLASRDRIAIDRDLLSLVAAVAAELGRLANYEYPIFLQFAPDPLPLEVHRRALKASIAVDEEDGMNGGSVRVDRVAEHAGLDVFAVRRALCRWLDEGLVYLHSDMSSLDGDEGFVLNEAAERRWDEWHEYEEECRKMRLMKLSIDYSDQLPHNYERIVRDVCASHEIEVATDGINATRTGIRVVITIPEDWSHDDARLETFKTEVRSMLKNPRVMMPPGSTSLAFHGDVIGSAVQAGSPGATQNAELTVDMRDVRQLFADVKGALATAELDEETREIVDAQIVAVDKQLAKEKPNPKLLRSLLTTLATALGTTGAAGQGVEYVNKLIHMVGGVFT